MPIKNGLQVVSEIREFFKVHQSINSLVKEPFYVCFTAYLTPAFKKHALGIGIN